MKPVYFVASLLGVAMAVPTQPRQSSELPRLVLYYQTTHDSNGRPVSILPLVTEKHIALTHLVVSSFHIHPNSNTAIHLNDHPSTQPHFSTLWNETRIMQAAGIKVMGMVGGAAPGSFTDQTLDGDDATFEGAYSQLAAAIRAHNLDGMDIDVEQPMSQAGITRLVQRLRADFGPTFTISLSPVASALYGPGDNNNLSGFNYAVLESDVGADIAFYNAQFYSGFGDLRSTRDYDLVVKEGWNPAKVVAGQLTAVAHGHGFIEFNKLNATVRVLQQKHGEIGGIMGWEYFNSNPSSGEPWKWAQVMTKILRPNAVPTLTITAATAEALKQAWFVSSLGGDAMPNVDYLAMINA